MANLTSNYEYKRKGQDFYPIYRECDGAAGVTFYQGGLVYLDTSYVLRRIPSATASASAPTIEAIGWSGASEYTVPSSNANKVPVHSGIWWPKANSTAAPVTAASLRKKVYAENDHTVRANDGGGIYPVAGILYSFQESYPQVLIGGPNVEFMLTGASNAFQARGVVYSNIADLTAFTVASDDGITYVEGDVILAPLQTTAAQCGPWVVGPVATGTAPLTRPAWWYTGEAIPIGKTIEIHAGGTFYGGSTWKAMRATAGVIGTHDPLFYPKTYTQTVSLASGTYTIGASSTATPDEPLFLYHATKSVPSVVRVGGTVHSSTVEYSCPTRTAGKAGTAALVVRADVAAGTINTSDASDLAVSLTNW